MQWNLRELLPPLVQKLFQRLVAEFILEMHQFTEAQREHLVATSGSAAAAAALVAAGRRGAAAAPDEDDGGDGDERAISPAAQFVRTLVQSTLAKTLFDHLADLRRHSSGASDLEDAEERELAFPQMADAQAARSTPALELVKYVVEVIKLDPRAVNAARALRRSALALIDVGEFADEATFRDPCVSVKLADVVCHYCDGCQDLDFGRDVSLLRDVSQLRCAHCHDPYDQAEIQEALIAHVQQRLTAYQLQDLRCPKCRAIKVGNLDDHCRCSSPFAPTVSARDLRTEYVAGRTDAHARSCVSVLTLAAFAPSRRSRAVPSSARAGTNRLTAYRQVARIYKMQVLEEIATWALPRLL